MELAAGGNGCSRWDWEGNGNKTFLNLGTGMRMRMNSWEREGMESKKTFPLITGSAIYPVFGYTKFINILWGVTVSRAVTWDRCRPMSQWRILTSKSMYTLSQKLPTFKLSVTSSNLNWFSKFLHCWKAFEICYKNRMTLPTSPKACCYTTLRN